MAGMTEEQQLQEKLRALSTADREAIKAACSDGDYSTYKKEVENRYAKAVGAWG